MLNKNNGYEKRIIAFIDILGFKEIIKQSEYDASKIELIYAALNYLKGWETPDEWTLKYIEIEEDAQKRGVGSFDLKGKVNVTAFSDSIVVSIKVNDDVNEMVSTLIANLAYIGVILIERGILIRGGLTIGNIIHTEDGTVFGQGLIDAYQLETRSAKYPRIVLSDKLINLLSYPLKTKRERYPYHQYLDRFEDGCVGFHQMIYYQVMESWTEMTASKLISGLSNIRKTIIYGLDNSFENSDVFEKYKWLKLQYDKLIILSDFKFEDKSRGNIKAQIRELKDSLYGYNIHYAYTINSVDEKQNKDT
jgi:hypothetical protein